MKPVWIGALGCVTSVGLRTSVTMGSVLTGAQRFDDVEVLRPDGEPLTGAAVRWPEEMPDGGRVAAMASLALTECVGAASRPLTAPVFLATADEEDLPGAAGLLSQLLGRHGTELDRNHSRSFAGGRDGTLHALATAVETLRAGRAETCYVAAVDSLLDPVRLRVLLGEDRLIDGPGADGFIPGEGAVVMRLDARPSPEALALLSGMGFNEGAPSSSVAIPGLALARAARQALQSAALNAEDVTGLVHDAGGPQEGFEDVSLALGRLRVSGAGGASRAGAASGTLETFFPARSVGETGAVAPLLSLATAAFFVRKDVFKGSVITFMSGNGPARSVAVVSPLSGKGDHGR